jgi:hypothetical protein
MNHLIIEPLGVLVKKPSYLYALSHQINLSLEVSAFEPQCSGPEGTTFSKFWLDTRTCHHGSAQYDFKDEEQKRDQQKNHARAFEGRYHTCPATIPSMQMIAALQLYYCDHFLAIMLDI